MTRTQVTVAAWALLGATSLLWGCPPSRVCVSSDASEGPPPEDGGGGPPPVDGGQCLVPDSGTCTCPGGDAGVYDCGFPVASLPLRTQGRWIVDSRGERFKLASVNWYGAEEQDYVVAGLEFEPLQDIAHRIRTMGFNSVRLPWSNEMYEQNPPIADSSVAANPQLKGRLALEVFDEVVFALAREGLLIILDNHSSDADWCCNDNDANGLWYTSKYPESAWIDDWKGMAQRYLSVPAVVGMDLRNEPRPVLDPTCQSCTRCPCMSCVCRYPVWGGLDPTLDWHGAAERAGNAILSVNPSLLIFVEGLGYSTDLKGAFVLPVRLQISNRLVYSPHDYSWFHSGATSYSGLENDWNLNWGALTTEGQPFTAPVWVGEFGNCHGSPTCLNDTAGGGFWYASFRQYLFLRDFDWAYWAVNGTQARGTGRTLGAEETYGVLSPDWKRPASRQHLGSLRALQPATLGP